MRIFISILLKFASARRKIGAKFWLKIVKKDVGFVKFAKFCRNNQKSSTIRKISYLYSEIFLENFPYLQYSNDYYTITAITTLLRVQLTTIDIKLQGNKNNVDKSFLE